MTEHTNFTALLVDMATLTVRHSKTTGIAQVQMADGYHLAALTIDPDTHSADVLYLALNHVMRHARIYSLDVLNPDEPLVRTIALYNPLTTEIELHTPQGTQVFRNTAPIPLPPEGLPVTVTTKEDNTAELALLTDENVTVLTSSARTFTEITRTLAAV